MDRSYDGGETWLSTDIIVANQPGGWDIKVPGHDRANGMPVLLSNPSKTNVRNHLYLVWADGTNGPDDTDVWFSRSVDNGDHWSIKQRINDDPTRSHQYLPWTAVDPVTGYIYIVYYDRRNYPDQQTDVYLAYSTNGGTTFTNVKISEQPFTPSEDSFFGDYTNIAAYNGIITPIWTRMDNGRTSVVTCVIRFEELAGVTGK